MPTTPYNRAGPGQPIPDYNEWTLQHRGAMAPWGVYENPQGETASGFAWPAMITEPIEAGKRFFAPGGGFENNPNPESEKDALTLLMSLYGGNALSGTFKGAALGNALADSGRMGLKDYGQAAYRSMLYPNEKSVLPPDLASAWGDLAKKQTELRGMKQTTNAQSSLIDTLENSGWSNENIDPVTTSDASYLNALMKQQDSPSLWDDAALRAEDDARYADLNRRSLETYGVGYEGLTREQTRHIRDGIEPPKPRATFRVIDGDLLSDTGKPNALGSALASQNALADRGVKLVGEHPNFDIMKDGQRAGYTYIREYPETVQMGRLFLDPEFQRQGIGTEAQKLVAEKYGKPNVPDVSLSEAELSRWKKNDPAAVADYEPMFPGSTSYSPKPGTAAYWASQGVGTVPGTRASAGDLFSDTGKPNALGSALASQMGDGSGAYHGSPHGAPTIEQVWGPRWDIMMGQQYRIAEAGGDLSTMYDILSAKYNKSPNIEPEIRSAMLQKIKEIYDQMGPEWRKSAGMSLYGAGNSLSDKTTY